ncbi:MAG: hypothetical protein LH618_17925 [Saprospiraceae bacterium]|nr:hypothetical protein [Saprospiraceae bacterium]
MPDGENSFKSLILGCSPSFEVQVNFPFSKIFQFETGYRYKEHWLAYKIMHIYIGYGYTQGTRTLAKGYYTIQTPTSTTKGSMITKGSYKYGMAGLRFTFSQKFIDSLPKL